MPVIEGYGRNRPGDYGRPRPPCPAIVEAAAWVIVLLLGPCLLFELGFRLARVLALVGPQ
jgi:hypothetical protein